ncbi:UDP-N-acetylglucosamine 2-epimerase (non-hydrolyzing) [Actinomadura spongiicola]|uniref:UDP-N-acetylglucosamine 2-epimerase (non-hydrolyzing) n=1 Tax=Actinomadura spongiicola TaxID=2303421 RepID=A0A372GDJ2_9ACTN|nr:UDP-N-acetylglucosamine 2-epimerase (non-hydrolyzing) [Actinomadura spongiicola]RFS83445.1 UDP-N-acetylglucosamine 2-epimerase (non-hydrolyzing) [Actinomadura spongiicola]
MVVLGTRPEAIKLAPVVRAMDASPVCEPIVVSSGQHREMLTPMLAALGVRAHADLGVMRDRQRLSGLTGRLVTALDTVIRDERPDVVIVQGDTTTAMCGALAASYEQIPVAHVEAGLRTGNLYNPFPEELNRQLIGRIAHWHFAPTERAAAHLRAEGIPAADVLTTGNTVIDNLHWMLRQGTGEQAFRTTGKRRILVTLHRRENQGSGMRGLAGAVRRLADRGDCEVLLPLHRSPTVRESLLPGLSGHPGVTIREPLGYPDFTATLAACDLVLTDSGGVQEEAPSLGKPVLVLRATTERPEAIDAGVARLVGTDPDEVFAMASLLLDDADEHDRMARAVNPFGDGEAADRIIGAMIRDCLRPDAENRPALGPAASNGTATGDLPRHTVSDGTRADGAVASD